MKGIISIYGNNIIRPSKKKPPLHLKYKYKKWLKVEVRYAIF